MLHCIEINWLNTHVCWIETRDQAQEKNMNIKDFRGKHEIGF